MLMDRIIGAFTFKTGVYAEVKKDTSFTPTAWGIVVVVNLLTQIASYLAAPVIAAAAISAIGSFTDIGPTTAVGASGSLVGALISAVIGVAAFAIACYVVMFVAKAMFQSTATFDELVRTMGLAYVWGIVGFLNILVVISPYFLCLTGIVGLAVLVLSILATAIAIKEALGLDWTQTIITVVIAWVVIIIVTALLGGIFFGALALGA